MDHREEKFLSSSVTASSGSWLVDVILWFDKKDTSTPITSFKTLPHFNPKAYLRPSSKSRNRLYLAYGSNLCASVFQGNRGIRPLAAINVLVPSLELVWDLPGIPYAEPCYASTRHRPTIIANTHDEHSNPTSSREMEISAYTWTKGLVGVVYEITPEDYRHVIATEGGGYSEIEVDCFPVPRNIENVPHHSELKGPPFKAYTLSLREVAGFSRRGPSEWGQPSRRYLDLLIRGAEEHSLPIEYRRWLKHLQPYIISTSRQRVGKTIFEALWFPWVATATLLERTLVNKEGPGWVKWVVEKCFTAMWWSYNYGFKSVFGDGEKNSET